MVDLAVCLKFKDEAPYLREWIEFHRLVGVQKFYLYNHYSTDAYLAVLRPYLETGIAVLHDWKRTYAHPSATRDCLRRHAEDAKWIAFLDADEFLFPTTEDSLPQVLQDFEAYPGVGVNWLFFGSSGHTAMSDAFVIERYLLRANTQDTVNTHIKSIVNPRQVLRPGTTHSFSYRNFGPAVNERQEPIAGNFSEPVSVDRLRINHYFCKSLEEGRKKIAKGQLDAHPRRTMDEWHQWDANANMVEDRTILRFLPALQYRLGRPHSLQKPAASYNQ